jgi:uncharacterized DUF497 family protein
MARRYPLRWDPGNVAHIWRHGVRTNEVEEVCGGDPLRRRGQDGRLILIGATQAGRVLAVVLELLPDGVYYPVTARPASRNERRWFAAEQKGDAT